MAVKQQERSVLTINAILDAAEEVFLEKGFEGGSLSAIANIAGVNPSLIAHHFGSKAGLWEAAWTRMYERYFNRQLEEFQRPDEHGDNILRDSIAAYFSFLKSTPGAIRLGAWLFLAGRDSPFPPAEEVVKKGIERLRQGQEIGVFRKDVPAEFIWAAFMSLVHHWFPLRQEYAEILAGAVDSGEDLDDAYLQSILKIFFEGVG